MPRRLRHASNLKVFAARHRSPMRHPSGPIRRIIPARVLIALPVLVVAVVVTWMILIPYCWYLGYEPRAGDS
jgi:hypothetical protein